MTRQVLHVVESLEPEAGAVAISLAGLFRSLRAEGIESVVLTEDGSGGRTDIQGGPAPEPRGRGRTHSAVPDTRSAQGPGNAAADARTTEEASTCPCHGAASVEEALGGADIVHIHGWGGELARTAARTALRSGKPYVISPLGGLSEDPYRGKGWKGRLRDLLGGGRMVHRAAAVAALNKWEHTDLQTRNVNARIEPLPYGLAVSEYAAIERTPHPRCLPTTDAAAKCLLMLGPIHPVEGLVPLLKAFAEIMSEASGWRIVIAGPERDDWRMMLEAAIRRKGASDDVRLVVGPDPGQQRAWLNRADILAAPALHARCPVSIMQAVAAGVPVIASKQAAPDGLNGAILTCGLTRAELKDALRSAMRLSDDERASLARNAQAVGRQVFDWSVLARRYVQLYKGLC